MPTPGGYSKLVAALRGGNGAPFFHRKLFQKTSLSAITLSSAGWNFSEGRALGTMPTELSKKTLFVIVVSRMFVPDQPITLPQPTRFFANVRFGLVCGG